MTDNTFNVQLLKNFPNIFVCENRFLEFSAFSAFGSLIDFCSPSIKWRCSYLPGFYRIIDEHFRLESPICEWVWKDWFLTRTLESFTEIHYIYMIVCVCVCVYMVHLYDFIFIGMCVYACVKMVYLYNYIYMYILFIYCVCFCVCMYKIPIQSKRFFFTFLFILTYIFLPLILFF